MSGTNVGLRRQYIDRLRETTGTGSVVSGRTTEPVPVVSRTLYFGGGTPSILSPAEIEEIYDIVGRPAVEEWTIECNPDDMTLEWLSAIKAIGVTRLSVGVQSLINEELKWMERSHTAEGARKAVGNARRAGFNNVSVDVMFGLPGQSLESLKQTIDGVLEMDVEHLSVYSLMFEEGSKITMKNIEPIDDDTAAEMYRMICERLDEAGYEHYEISNWAKPGYRSRHNYGYWTGEPYIGFGPAAHSFDGHATRWANVPNTIKWLKGEAPEVEHLTDQDRFNERIMLGLRTAEGIDLNALRHDFPEEWTDQLIKDLSRYSSVLNPSSLDLGSNSVTLFPKGVYISDLIMQSCMRI